MGDEEESAPLWLNEYHFYEPETETKKEYGPGKFRHDYGQGERTYEYSSVSASIKGPWWTVAKEVLEDDDREQLQQWCRCELCKMFIFNPDKWIACAHCYHCLKYQGNDQKVIDDSRNYKRLCTTSKYLMCFECFGVV